MGKTGNGTMNRSEESITLMTSYRLPHHGRRSFFTFVQDDAFRSPSFSTFSWRLKADSSQLIADSFYLLTAFLITAADPSRSFRMTINVSLIMKPYRISSFRAEVRMLYETTGRRLCDTERRIYYPRWRLTFPSLQQQIPCWCFVWHLMEIICFGF